MERVAYSQLVGQELLAVTAALHDFEGHLGDEPVHAWLHFSGLGAVKCHTQGAGDLKLTAEQPYAPYDMQEHGRVVIAHNQPRVLAAHVGEVVEAVTPLWQEPPGMTVGVALRFSTGAVGVANLGDSLVVETWPSGFRDEHLSEAADL